MLDDRQLTPSSRDDDLAVWSRGSNTFGWQSYLGDLYGRDDVPATAAPARATDLSGLPPALVSVGAVDGFRDEDVDYATRLNQAGVPTELHVYPGACHGFNVLAPKPPSRSSACATWRTGSRRSCGRAPARRDLRPLATRLPLAGIRAIVVTRIRRHGTGVLDGVAGRQGRGDHGAGSGHGEGLGEDLRREGAQVVAADISGAEKDARPRSARACCRCTATSRRKPTSRR